MARTESAHFPEHCNRRQALQGAAACGALALPVALLAAGPAVANSVHNGHNSDPHIAWWSELRELRAEDSFDDEQIDREHELEKLIAQTPPTTAEGVAVICTMILAGHKLMYCDPTLAEVEDQAGGTLARYLLGSLPADVLQRAGLEARS